MLSIEELLTLLGAAYGPQRWWPAESPFEVMVGAVLVQRTAWRNAERAIARLKLDRLMNADALALTDSRALAELVRPAGFYRAKAACLRSLAEFVVGNGGIEGMQRWSDDELKRSLLGLRGVGEETASAIQLYAFGRPVWVVDAYSRRMFARLSGRVWDDSNAVSLVRPLIAARDVARLNELHALIVEHGKRHCRARPLCADCILRQHCAHALSQRRLARGVS